MVVQEDELSRGEDKGQLGDLRKSGGKAAHLVDVKVAPALERVVLRVDDEGTAR